MPSMTTSHGGILYYVVKVPKEPSSQATQPAPTEPGSPGQRSFDEKAAAASSTPLLSQHDESTDSGWDNPFRPDGDLSREADEIVELIKGGKPITPTPLNGEAPKLPDGTTTENGKVPSPVKAAEVSANKSANGKSSSSPLSNGGDKKTPGGQVELQHATVVPPSDASQVEHVNLKKKPKCKCCVIQ